MENKEFEFPSDKNNPICWIPSDKLMRKEGPISHLPILDMGSCNDKDKVALMSVAYSAASEILRAKHTKEGILETSNTIDTIPFVWTLKLDPVLTLKACVGYLSAALFYTSIRNTKYKGFNSKDLLGKVIVEIQEMPPHYFHVLTPFLYFPEVRKRIISECSGVDPPHSAPYGHQALLRCLKNIVVWICLNQIDKAIEILPTQFFFISKRISMSPVSILFIQEALSAEDGDQSFCHLLEVKNLIDKFPGNKVELMFNTPLFSSFILSLLEKNENINENLKDMIIRFSEETLNSRVCLASPEWLVKKFPSNPDWDEEENVLPTLEIGKIVRLKSPLLQLYHEKGGLTSVCKIGTPRYRCPDVMPNRHFIRPLPNITTAHYKYLGLITLFRDEISVSKNVAVVGDGTGGVTALLLRVFPHIKVLYNSLVNLEGVFPQSLATFRPPAMETLGIPVERLIGFPESIEIISDITNPNFPEFIGSITDESIDILICDAEGGGWDSPEKGVLLAMSLTTICLTCKTQSLVLKTFLSNVGLVAAQIGIIHKVFQVVTLFGSVFSGENSTECFIYASRPRGVVIRDLNIHWDNDARLVVEGISVRDNILDELYVARQLLIDKRMPSDDECYKVSDLLSTEALADVAVQRIHMWTLGVISGSLTPWGQRFRRFCQTIRTHLSPIFVGIRQHLARIVGSFVTSSMACRLTLAFLWANLHGSLKFDDAIKLLNKMKDSGYLMVYRTRGHSWGCAIVFYVDEMIIQNHPHNFIKMEWTHDKTLQKVFLQQLGYLYMYGTTGLENFHSIQYSIHMKTANSLNSGVVFIPGQFLPSNKELRRILIHKSEHSDLKFRNL